MGFISSHTQGYDNVWISPTKDTVITLFLDAPGSNDDDGV
jgi:hypothetical protein